MRRDADPKIYFSNHGAGLLRLSVPTSDIARGNMRAVDAWADRAGAAIERRVTVPNQLNSPLLQPLASYGTLAVLRIPLAAASSIIAATAPATAH